MAEGVEAPHSLVERAEVPHVSLDALVEGGRSSTASTNSIGRGASASASKVLVMIDDSRGGVGVGEVTSSSSRLEVERLREFMMVKMLLESTVVY